MRKHPSLGFIDDKNTESFYPSTDGKPMADNTLQFDYIVKIKTNLESLYKEQEVFVAGDLFWYPVEGNPKIVTAPDVMLAYERPKGHRLSYKQWEEGNIAPQVVFEVLSKSNSTKEMLRKQKFYERHGVQEFIIIDPKLHSLELIVYQREGKELVEAAIIGGIWKSPTMGITIELQEKSIEFFFADGQPFRTVEDWTRMFNMEQQAKQRAEQKAEQEKLAKEKAMKEIERLKAALAKK